MFQECGQLAKRVGKRIGKVNLVLAAFRQRVAKRQLIEVATEGWVFTWTPHRLRLTVLNVLAGSLPHEVLALTRNTNSHAAPVQSLRLREVADCEFNFAAAEKLRHIVAHREIKPLVVTSGVRVHSHIKVILPGSSLDDHVQVSAFEVRIKSQLFGAGEFRVHPSELSRFFCVFFLFIRWFYVSWFLRN